jgi:Tetracyclin repressor-like, C-terminal domain
MESHMQHLNANLEHIVQEPADAQQRLHEAVANHIRLHTTYKAEFFIIDTEIRALEGENRHYILSLRDRYEALLQSILRDGMEEGIFRQSDVKVCSYAIIAMCTEVAAWFRPEGRLSVQQVIDMYTQMITQGLLATRESVRKPEESVHT